jgi:hypothetical protein
MPQRALFAWTAAARGHIDVEPTLAAAAIVHYHRAGQGEERVGETNSASERSSTKADAVSSAPRA